ncbi:hypothetical protein JMUB7523_26410 [Staphylococcus aureus]
MIQKNDKEFKEGMERARKEVNYAADTDAVATVFSTCLLYTSPSPRDYAASRMPSSA